MLPTRRVLHRCLGRAGERHRHLVYGLLPVLGFGDLTTCASPKSNVFDSGGQSEEFVNGVGWVPVRSLAAASSQPCISETTEDKSERMKKTEFLHGCGLSIDQATQVLKQCQILLTMSLEDELEPKVEFFRALGLSDLAKAIVISPHLLLGRLETTLMPRVALLESAGIHRQSIGKIIERYPFVLSYSEANMMSKIKFLEDIGLDRENIAKAIMRCPYFFALSIEENMRPKVELLESIGVNRKLISKLISKCPKIFCLSNEDNVLPKIKYLESVGVEKESMGKIVATCPSILNLSTSHIQKKLDFLEANNYCVKTVVNAYPSYLTYSLELRIKPRHRLISSLRELGMLKKGCSLSHMLQISQKKFLKDYVNRHPLGNKYFEGGDL